MSIFKKRALRRNRFSKIVHFIISLAVVFNTSALGVFLAPSAASASQQAIFSIAITAVNGVSPSSVPFGPFSNPISLYGTVSVQDFPGLMSHYQVQIDWGDGNVDNNSLISFSGSNGQNCNPLTGASCDDFSGTWASDPNHSYLTGGSKTIKTKLYHTQPPGAESGDATAQLNINVVVVNNPPEANAGPDQIVDEDTSVALNGSGSYDPDGDHLTYSWTQISGPAVTLSNSTSDNPSFTAPSVSEDTTLKFKLTVSDGILTDWETVSICVKNVLPPPNVAPTAEANGPYSGFVNEPILFSSAGSADSDGSIVSYEWDFDYDGITFNTESSDMNPSHTYQTIPFPSNTVTVALRVTDDDGAQDIDTALATLTSQQNYTLTAVTAGTGSGIIAVDPAGTNCGSACHEYLENTAVTITANVNTGSVFAGWSGDCTGTNLTCEITMNSAKLVTATFNLLPPPPPPVLTPNLSVTKTADKTSVKPGDSFKYKIHVANTGTGAATGVAVSDDVPNGLKIDGVGCSVSGGATCNITSTANPVGVTGDLPADSFFDVFVDVTVKPDAAAGTVKNTTTVTHSGSGFSGSFSDSGLSITALPVVQPVNAKPVANAHGPYEAVLKDGKAEVSLVGTGTDTDGSIVKYEWDFEGDGIFDLAILTSPTVTNGSVSHIYTKAGSYNPVLRVTDDKGATAADTTKAMILSHGTAVLFDVGPDGLIIAADGQLALFATATDSLGNSWDATADTVFTANDPCGAISQSVYLPCQAGEWEIQAAYQSLADKIGVKVVTGELNRLEISPYAKPFKIRENKSQVFTVKGFDSDNNEVTILDPEWSTTGEKVAIGKIDKNGKFLATHGGIGRVTAEAGELSASVGIIVKEVKAAAPAKKKSAPVATAGTGGEEPVSDQAGEPAESDLTEEEPVVSSEETKPAEDGEVAGGTVAGEEEQACTTLPWWAWYLLAAFYAIFLIIYYMNLRRLDKEHGMVRNWWAIPLLLTGVMLGIYFLYRCPGVFLRWPWALILGGVIISAVYYQSREPEDLPPAGSAMGGDNNIKSI